MEVDEGAKVLLQMRSVVGFRRIVEESMRKKALAVAKRFLRGRLWYREVVMGLGKLN